MEGAFTFEEPCMMKVPGIWKFHVHHSVIGDFHTETLTMERGLHFTLQIFTMDRYLIQIGTFTTVGALFQNGGSMKRLAT
jgi:hypothetical protein